MYIHVLKLHRKFELIPIKIGFFTNFLSCSKIGPKSLYYRIAGNFRWLKILTEIRNVFRIKIRWFYFRLDKIIDLMSSLASVGLIALESGPLVL